MWPGVVAGSPMPKDIPDTKKEEGRGFLPKSWSVHVLIVTSIYPEEKK